MKRIILLLMIFQLTIKVNNCLCQWYPQPLPATGNINQMQFINSQTGWIFIESEVDSIKYQFKKIVLLK